MAGADCRATGSGTKFIPNACTGFLETYSLWMDTLLSLDIVGRGLDLPQSNVLYFLWGVDGGEVGEYVKGIRGEEGVGTWIGMYSRKR